MYTKIKGVNVPNTIAGVLDSAIELHGVTDESPVDDDVARVSELNVRADNCSGQNMYNYHVLYVLFLFETGNFRESPL
ncbi:hypothetical protein PybrP1_002972 [[Pythium] brassicae (nom. inval.)]|nr:hypothetical protein PybrP1_002972 [[Pythium] brassicae (nom. inval.)]